MRYAVVKVWNGMPDPQVIDYAETKSEAEKIRRQIPSGRGYRTEIWEYVSGGVAP